MIYEKLPIKAHRKYLLWALIFLKIYATEHVNSVRTNADEKLFGSRFVYIGIILKFSIGKYRFSICSSFNDFS